MNLNSWPFDQPEKEQQLLAEALARCETVQQGQQVLGAFLLGDILVSVLSRPPARRDHWWQFWRRRPGGI
jgi:hypothetical protein